MTDDETLARELAQTWIKPITVSSVAEMPATMMAVTVTSRSYEEVTNELANLIAPFLARVRLDEAKWWREWYNQEDNSSQYEHDRAVERIRTLEQAAGASRDGAHMTRQQAGVSAEAVAKLVEKWRSDSGRERLEPDKPYDLTYGVAKQSCADELEALATAPPEQASEPFSSRALSALAEDILADANCTAKKMQSIWERAIFDKRNGWQVIADLFNANRPSTIADPPQTGVWSDWPGIFAETIRCILESGCHPNSLRDARFNLESYSKQVGDTRPIKLDQPQAVSAGARSAEPVTPQMMSEVFAKSINNTDPEHPHLYDHRIAATELNRLLAAHDQKVRDQLAAWMIANSFATGHGDTVEDLLKELKWQIEELRARPAPAASKPASEGEVNEQNS